MSHPLESGIFRILDAQDHIHGAGFLIAEGVIATCAHVVSEAGGSPGQSLTVVSHTKETRCTAVVSTHYWDEHNDVAFLELTSMLPIEFQSLPLGSNTGYANHQVTCLGYPNRYYAGLWGKGTILGLTSILLNAQTSVPLIQVDSGEITPGFSGSPLWDEKDGCVIGMVTRILDADKHDRLGRVAFATPLKTLQDVNPHININRQRLANPFGLRGRIEDPALYLVRQPLTDEIFGELKKHVSLSIVGEAQTGKSSLLWHIQHVGPQALNRPAQDFALLRMELVHTEDEFYTTLCEELGTTTCRGIRLGRALRDRQIILCLDEVEKMTWQGFTMDLRSELRGLADGPSAPLTLVIASRSPLDRLFPDSPEMTSPLAGLCTRYNLPPFSLAEAQSLADAYLQGSGFSLQATEIEQAWQNSRGHPGMLQQDLKDAFDRMNSA